MLSVISNIDYHFLFFTFLNYHRISIPNPARSNDAILVYVFGIKNRLLKYLASYMSSLASASPLLVLNSGARRKNIGGAKCDVVFMRLIYFLLTSVLNKKRKKVLLRFLSISSNFKLSSALGLQGNFA